MRFKAESGLLSIFLALSPVAGLGDDTPQNTERLGTKPGAEFHFNVKHGNHVQKIPVDCDLLAQNGELTPEFVKNMDVWGHLGPMDAQSKGKYSDEQRLFVFKSHMRSHGILPQTVDAAAQHCRDKYLPAPAPDAAP